MVIVSGTFSQIQTSTSQQVVEGTKNEKTDQVEHWSSQKDQSDEKGTIKSPMTAGLGEKNFKEEVDQPTQDSDGTLVGLEGKVNQHQVKTKHRRDSFNDRNGWLERMRKNIQGDSG